MAYDFFPKTEEELQKKIRNHPPQAQGDLYLLYTYLKEKFPTLETPINLDLRKKNSANISRSLQEDISISKIKREAKISSLSMKFGNGSSGNRGVNNRGNLFEPQFADALLKWWKGESVTDSKMLKAILDLDKTYELRKSSKLVIDVVGGENTRRPLVYTPYITLTNPKGSGDDVGKSVTDITLKTDTQEIYLSLKMGTTVTFFNVGVRTVLTPDEIKAYNITNADGIKLLNLFNIDHKIFCDVFNGKHRGSSIPVNTRVDVEAMRRLMRSGIGKGYHIIHKLSGKILSKQMDEAALRIVSSVTTAKIYYGGKTGQGKRVDIEMESPTYIFKLNIRDTQGKDGYPTRLMCDFSYK